MAALPTGYSLFEDTDPPLPLDEVGDRANHNTAPSATAEIKTVITVIRTLPDPLGADVNSASGVSCSVFVINRTLWAHPGIRENRREFHSISAEDASLQ
jgi:hypothetical protein